MHIKSVACVLLFPLTVAAQMPAAQLQPAAPSAAATNSVDATGSVVAQRGSLTLTVAELRAALAALDPESRQKLLDDRHALTAFVRDRMVYAVIIDEARSKGWEQRPEIAARVDQVRKTVIVESYVASLSQPDPAYPSDSDIQAAYDSARAKLFTPKQVRLAQIFLAVPPGATKAVDDDAHGRITDLRAQAAKPKADFASLARKASEDRRTAAAGGDLGWVRDDQVVPQIRSAISALSDGALADPVRLPDGWHLVRLVATRPPVPASLAEAHDTLVTLLRQAKQQQAARAYLDGLQQAAPVQVNEIALGSVAGK